MESDVHVGGRGFVALGLVTLLVGVILAIATANLPSAASYAGVGARLFPAISAAGLIGVGLWLAVQGWRIRHVHGSGERSDPIAFVAMIGGLIAHMLLLETAGFVIASTILFFAVTLAFRDGRWLFNLGIAFALALITRVVLGYGLGLSLPTLLPGGVI